MIEPLHKLQRYYRFTLALIALITLAMFVVGIPAVRAQVSKLMVASDRP